MAEAGAAITALLCLAAIGPALGGDTQGTSAADPYAVSYITINASEGQASGGHAAMRFGQQVYHFEFDDSLVRAVRDDFDLFQSRYRFEDNRSLTLYPLHPAPETEQRFAAQLERQNREWAYLDQLDADVQLLEQLAQPGNSLSMELKGAGLFATHDTTLPDAGHSARHAIAATLARDLHLAPEQLRQQRAALLAMLQPYTAPDAGQHDGVPVHERAIYHVSGRYHDTLCLLLLLDALEQPIALRADALVWLPPRTFALAASQRRQLKTLESRLRQELRASLLRPLRPDQGPGLLARLARLHAINLSLRYNTWVLLNRNQPSQQKNTLSDATLASLEQKLLDTWQELATSPLLDETDYHLLELDGNALTAVMNSRRQGVETHWQTEGLPARRANYSLPKPAGHNWSLQSEQQRTQRDDWHDHLTQQYRYHLLERNCVTEIFRTLDAPVPGFPFSIPELSAMALGSLRQQTLAALELPSYRMQRWSSEPFTEDPLISLAALLPWTDPAFAPDEDASSFLFHTDTLPWARPALGGANLGYAALDTLAGLGTWPMDDGQRLRQGAKGMLMSVPELFFFNIRKGHFLVAPLPPRLGEGAGRPPATVGDGKSRRCASMASEAETFSDCT